MIRGQYGEVWIQRDEQYPPGRLDRIEPEIRRARLTRYAVIVKDKDKDTFFGLVPGEGWWLYGGLLSCIEVQDESIELFGKEAIKVSSWGTTDRSKDMWVDFFLLRRPNVGAPANLLRKWSFGPGDIVVTMRPGNPHGGISVPEYSVGGSLRYDSTTKDVEVRLHGLKIPVVEHMRLSDESAK
jgi:hypothetical protein